MTIPDLLKERPLHYHVLLTKSAYNHITISGSSDLKAIAIGDNA
jgi:hypothetical protein